MNHYEIEPMFGNKPVEIEYDVHYSFDPGNRDTPPNMECSIESIRHRGREVSEEALIRLFSIHHGCHMPYEKIEEMLLENWFYWHEDDDKEYYADLMCDQRREEGI
jgi:hypothetical protein